MLQTDVYFGNTPCKLETDNISLKKGKLTNKTHFKEMQTRKTFFKQIITIWNKLKKMIKRDTWLEENFKFSS